MTGQYWTYQINPVSGCIKISEGCQHCYAERTQTLHHACGSGKGFFNQPFEKVTLRPEQLKKFDELARKTTPQIVFVGNMADLFQDSVPDEYIYQVFNKACISANEKHTFLFLTKRAQRLHDFVAKGLIDFEFHKNIWLGVTVENDRRNFERVPLLLETQAAHRWLSIEPILEKFTPLLFYSPQGAPRSKIDLCIVGGESGHNARVAVADWFVHIYKVCKDNDVRVYMKQPGDAFSNRSYNDEYGKMALDDSAFTNPFTGEVKV